MWRTWVNRTLIEGLNASASIPNPYAALMPYMPPGSSECISGWRGLSPLALNPLWYTTNPVNGPPPGYNPAVHGPVEWTHWADLVNIYGLDEHGFARSPWSNVGVQYGLSALTSGAITPEQFLDLNANVGSWKPSHEMVQEGCPYIPTACATPANIDVWSARNMNLSPDGGTTPAARREGPRGGLRRLPLRHGLPREARHPRHRLAPLPRAVIDMHNSHQSFAARPAAPELRRRRLEPVDLVHGRAGAGAPGAVVRPDADGAPSARRMARDRRETGRRGDSVAADVNS